MASPCAVVARVAAPEHATEAVRRCLHQRTAPLRAQHCVLHVHGALNAVQLADELDTDPVAAPVLRLHQGGPAILNEHHVDPPSACPRSPTSRTWYPWRRKASAITSSNCGQLNAARSQSARCRWSRRALATASMRATSATATIPAPSESRASWTGMAAERVPRSGSRTARPRLRPVVAPDGAWRNSSSWPMHSLAARQQQAHIPSVTMVHREHRRQIPARTRVTQAAGRARPRRRPRLLPSSRGRRSPRPAVPGSRTGCPSATWSQAASVISPATGNGSSLGSCIAAKW